jgi:hypothetical protein
MFGGFRYRTEVTVEIHAILMLVPKLGDLLKTIPELKVTMNELRRTGVQELEAASSVSLLVIEKLIRSVPRETLALTFQQLLQKRDNFFAWFAPQPEADHSKDLPLLTMVLGHAFWYLGVALQQNNLSEQTYRVFVGDVLGMLQGKSEEQRGRDRLAAVLWEPTS